MGTAESLLYYDEGGGEVGGGGEAEGASGTNGPSVTGQQVNSPAPSHHVPSSSGSSSNRPHSAPPPSSIHHLPPEQKASGGTHSRRQQNGGGGNTQQSPPLTLRGFVIGSSGSGKTCLVRRLRGENPFADAEDVLAAERQQRQRRQRKRKMMALVPWRDRQSGQHCQLHVVEKTNDVAAADDEADGVAAATTGTTTRDIALEALGDRPDFCICMVDPRSESSVEFAKTAIGALLSTASVDDDRASSPSSSRTTTHSNTNTNTNTNSNTNGTHLARPNICVLVNYMDSIKVVEEELKEAGDTDGLFRMTQSRLLDICADIISLQTAGDADDNGAATTIPPSIQIYPASMVSCSGLSSLHSFIMLPYMRKKEVKMLQQLEVLRRNHNKSRANLRDGGVKAMQEAIVEGKARMSTAPPISSGRRSIIQRQKVQGVSNGSGLRKSAATPSGWEKRVRIDETRNTNHFEGDDALPTKSTTSSVRLENIDEMTQRLEEADQARRRRRQQALDGEKTGEEGTKRSSRGEEESSGSGRRSIMSSKQRHAMQETISKLPTTSSSKRKQPRKQTKNVTDDPMKALEDFLGSDSDSDTGGDPIRSGVVGAVEGSDSDNDSCSDVSGSASDDDEGPRPSILLSDSDSEDDDFYYDQEGHAHYSHLDNRKKPAAKTQVDVNPTSEQVESEEEVSADSNVDTPKKRDSKTLRSDHDEEEKKDESPSGRPTTDEDSKRSPSLSDDEEEAVGPKETGGESSERHEILDSQDESSASAPSGKAASINNEAEENNCVANEILDSDDESGSGQIRPEILYSDDESSVEKGINTGAGTSPNASPPVQEILHSDDDDDNSDSPDQNATKILHRGDESEKKLESKAAASTGRVQVLDSDDFIPSAPDQPIEILHSDDDNDDNDDDDGGADDSSSAPLSGRNPVANDSIDESESSRVEILHSDEDEEEGEPSPKPAETQGTNEAPSTNSEQAAPPSYDDVSDSEPPVASSSSNILVEALEADEAADDEPESPEPEPVSVFKPEESNIVSEEPTAARMSAAVAAALAAAEEEARRMMMEVVPPGGEETRRKKKKSKKKSTDGEERKRVKKKKSSSRRSARVVE